MEFLDPEPLGHAGRPTVGSLDCYGPLLQLRPMLWGRGHGG